MRMSLELCKGIELVLLSGLIQVNTGLSECLSGSVRQRIKVV